MSSSGCWSAPGARRVLVAALGAALVMGAQAGWGSPVAAAAAGPVQSGRPNQVDPRAGTRSVRHLPAAPRTAVAPAAFSQPRPAPPVSMRPALVGLDPMAGGHFVGSDGVLELTAPAGAVSGTGQSLLVRQVLPASGSNAGGSGEYTFGTWLVQVVDAAGQPAPAGLRREVTLKLHEDPRATALGLDHVRVAVNAPLPGWVDLSPSAAAVAVAPASGTPASGASAPVGPASGARRATPATPAPPSGGGARPSLGPLARRTASVEAAAGQGPVLTAAVPLAGPNTAVSFDTNAPVATFGRPDPFETDLSAGALSAGIPLDLPAGPGGLKPPLSLAYNSAGVSDQHNPQGAAPWVGEGWSMGLGAISWAEHQVHSSCLDVCQPLWEDSWLLSDPFGTAADLVPPNIDVATFLHDSPNPVTASPIAWHTAPESRARVISINAPFALPNNAGGPPAPCFRVFLPSGIMEEFGCTTDSMH